MSKTKTNLVEINGRQYDATTGIVVTRPTANSAVASVARAKLTVKRTPAKPAAAHAPKASRTLMRHTVKQPADTPKRHSRAQGPARAGTEQLATKLVVKQSASRLDNKRVNPASQVAKSQLIKHFAPLTAEGSHGLALSPQPGSVITPAPAQSAVKAAGGKPQTTADLLEIALQRAADDQPHQPTAAKRQKRASRRKQLVGIAGGGMVVAFLLAGVISQNMTNLQLQQASAKAGFVASLPDYRPAGYSMAKLRYATGVVSTSFHSNSDARAYTITQKLTEWDSAALFNLLVAPQGPDYQLVDLGSAQGYLYGNRNAAWINEGKLYQIQSNGSLNDRQLVELATSL